jgi:hypothetical protein
MYRGEVSGNPSGEPELPDSQADLADAVKTPAWQRQVAEMSRSLNASRLVADAVKTPAWQRQVAEMSRSLNASRLVADAVAAAAIHCPERACICQFPDMCSSCHDHALTRLPCRLGDSPMSRRRFSTTW